MVSGEGTHFRVWAANHQNVYLIIENEGTTEEYLMEKEKNSYFSLFLPHVRENYLYRFKFLNEPGLWSDPASRYQPFGPDEPSCIVNTEYHWTDDQWPGITLENQIIYEIHIGTFTLSGTFSEAAAHLKELADLGITIIELMPLNEFPGKFGWGYDGVNLFAPAHIYGTPNQLKALINQAHELGIAVILDVVYNHFGPEHNHLLHFSKEYIKEIKMTEWGNSINFDDFSSREFFLTNAKYWISEFHFDGLRIDATYCLFSDTLVHILKDLSFAVKKSSQKSTIIIGEDEPQNSQLLMPYEANGYGFDALWNDDFHHSAHVRLTGRNEAYYSDYRGSPQEFVSLMKYGFLYQGQFCSWQNKNRGIPNYHLPHQSMVIYLENHDQLANSFDGKRVKQKTDPGNYRAMSCLLLLSPNTPLLFQGQEFGSEKPFLFFSDHSPEVNKAISEGRRNYLKQFLSISDSNAAQKIPDCSDPKVFKSCQLDWSQKNPQIYALYKDLIKIKKNDKIFKQCQKLKVDGAVFGPDLFLIRYFAPETDDRLIIINFGLDYALDPAPEPLVAYPNNRPWEVLWSSEEIEYGGGGTINLRINHWKIAGHSAMVLKIKALSQKDKE